MKINIGIDDISSCVDTDLFHVIDMCWYILDSFSNAKFDLFVSTAYFRTFDGHKVPFFLSHNEEVVGKLNSLVKQNEDNFRICYHGHFHGVPFISNNDEFRKSSYDETIKTLVNSKKELAKCGLEAAPILRPPAFHVSEESIRAMIDFGIKHVSLYEVFKQRGEYDSLLNKFDNNLFSFVNCAPPAVPLEEKDNLIVMYHALNSNRNFFSKKEALGLIDFLKRQSSIDFMFLGGNFS